MNTILLQNKLCITKEQLLHYRKIVNVTKDNKFFKNK